MLQAMNWRRTRTVGVVFLLGFFGASLVAPHRHLNPIADLVTDGPSDSGTVLIARTDRPNLPGTNWAAADLVDDEPCLACFWHDVTAAVSTSFAVRFAAVILFILPAQPPIDRPQHFVSRPISRGPPVPASV